MYQDSLFILALFHSEEEGIGNMTARLTLGEEGLQGKWGYVSHSVGVAGVNPAKSNRYIVNITYISLMMKTKHLVFARL